MLLQIGNDAGRFLLVPTGLSSREMLSDEWRGSEKNVLGLSRVSGRQLQDLSRIYNLKNLHAR